MKQAKKKIKKPVAAGDGGKKKTRQNIHNKKEKKLRVLILEDNLNDAELMERQLKKDGIDFSAQRVDTRSEFLKVLKAFQPDLILADYKLPKFDGLQALELRNKIVPLTPFIIITGSISEEIAVECMKRGADDYLLKDRLSRLGEAVRHALEKRRLHAEKIAAEESLRASELLYRTFIDSSADMAFLKDDRCRHLLANRALCAFYGKTEKQIIGKTDFELMERKAAQKCESSDRQALAENRVHASEETIGDRTYEIRKFPVKLVDGRIGVGGYIRDISAQIQAESKIYESEAKYRLISENSADVIWILDIASQRFTYMSPSIIKLRGLTPKEAMAKPMAAALTPESYQGIVARLSGRIAALAAGDESARVRTNEVDQVRRDGSIVHTEVVTTLLTDADGRATEILGVSRDISERKRAEEALLENQAQLKAFMDFVPSMIMIKDHKLRPIFANEAMRQSFPIDQWLGKKPHELFTPEVADQMISKDSEALGKGFTIYEEDWIDRFGQQRFFLTQKFRIDLPNKEPLLGAIISDISERKQAENRLKASLQEKEVLLKEIHHRVKNNLQVISGLLTLQGAQINDERLQKLIKESQGRIWTMALIHQTLYQSGNLAEIDMADYIRTLCGNLLSSYAQVAMPPAVSFDLVPLRLVIDKAIPLALIINELVTNAMKHAFPEGRSGEIRISLQEHLGTTGYAPAYELTVADDGGGLPAGFDPKDQKSLGLQLVAMLTKQLGGTLAFASRRGTSVHIGFSDNEKSEKYS